MIQKMAPSGGPGADDRLARALETHSMEAMQFLIHAKVELDDDAYSKFIKTVQEIVKRSLNPDGGITIKQCEEILSQLFVGRTRLLKGFHNFLEARDPFHDDPQALQALSFIAKVKASPYISNEDYDDLLATLSQFASGGAMKVEDVYEKAKRAMRQCPEFIEIFETFLPPSLRVPRPNEQSCRSPNTSPTGKEVLCFAPDPNHSLDGIPMKTTNIKNNVSQMEYPHDQNHEGTEYNFRQKHTQSIPYSFQMPTKGNGESLQAEEYEGDKIDPLPDWSPSRENELPPKVDLDMCACCTPSYYLLPKNCLTLQSSYQTQLGQSIFNDTLVSATSGREDCFKFRTKNHHEENIFKCEDDMFECDMILQRYRATADFVANLQGHADSNMKIQEHLTSIHWRCIEQLYNDLGLDMLEILSENKNISTSLALLHSRLNQKIEDLSEAQSSLNKICSTIIANNYYRSLDHHSSSFKQLDKRRMNPKALLAEAKEINMTRLNDGDKNLSSACYKQSHLIWDNVLHIHKEIDSMVHYASKIYHSEQKLMMIWTKLVRPFVSINCQSPELDGTVAFKEACEHCGLSKKFLRSIPDALLANNLPLSSKGGGYLGNTSNKSTFIQDACKADIEGEFIPDLENIQLGSMPGPRNGAASYDVAAPSGDGSSFRCPDLTICGHGNKLEVRHESRKGSNVEMGSLACSKRIAELHDVTSGIPCCSLAVLLRLHQIFYDRLILAKVLSREGSDKAPKRDSGTCDLYAGFKERFFSLLKGSTDNSNFEEYCLNFLGPRSYVLFTLDELIRRVITQLAKICPGTEDNLLLQPHEEVRGPNPSNDSFHHQNAKSSPARPANASPEQDPEGEKGSKPLDDTVKPMQNHFQRRKKRKLENGQSISQPGADNSNS